MPSIFTHSIFAALVGRSFLPGGLPLRFWILSILCPVIPDGDAVSFAFRVERGSMWGHRGITHSILFAVILGTAAAVFGFGKEKPFRTSLLALYFSLITVSHPLLDMLTNGGSGVALLAPFSGERFFFPWRPIEVSPIGIGFFSARGLDVLLSEIKWAWLPAVALLGASLLIRKAFGREDADRTD